MIKEFACTLGARKANVTISITRATP